MREERLENVKKEISSVIITYQNGVTLDSFLKTFRQLLGVRLPTREFGFTSDIDFLYSLSDVVRVQSDRNGDYLLNCLADEKTEHIQKLVQKQKTVSSKQKNNFVRNNHEKLVNRCVRIKPFVSASLRKNLFEVLREFPDGISYYSLCVAYQKKFNRPLNLDFISESLHDRLRKLEIAVSELQVKVIEETERLFYCPLTRKDRKNSVEKLTKSPFNNSSSIQQTEPRGSIIDSTEISVVPQHVKEDFEKVLKLYPNGVFAKHFPFLYEKVSGELFDLADLGYNNFLELADSLPDIFIYLKPYDSPNEWVLFHPCFSETASKLKELNDTLALSKERNNTNSERNFKEIPSDIVLPSKSYKPPCFSDDINLSIYIPVFISAASNPGCFWFKLQTEEVTFRFRELEDDLQGFYHSEEAELYKIRSSDVRIGSTCVAMHEDHWYRVTITSSPNVDLVNVYLVDYGSWERVHSSNLCYLKSCFFSLPSQAFKAQLALIKPANEAKTWSKKATARFLQLCIRSYIMAQIQLETDESLSVILCDTSGEDDVYINDILVDEHLAESHSQDETDSAISSVFEASSTKELSTLTSTGDGPQRVYLGDDYWTTLIMILSTPYVTASDLCHLFWPDKSADTLKSRLQCKNVKLSSITIFREKYGDLFLKCESNGTPGFSSPQNSVELYSLSSALKVLNCFGHPSRKVRETIKAVIKDSDYVYKLSKESLNQYEVDTIDDTADSLNKCCLYDLKAMYEAAKFKRLTLQKRCQEAPFSDATRDLRKVETLMETIQGRMNHIDSLCSLYANQE